MKGTLNLVGVALFDEDEVGEDDANVRDDREKVRMSVLLETHLGVDALAQVDPVLVGVGEELELSVERLKLGISHRSLDRVP